MRQSWAKGLPVGIKGLRIVTQRLLLVTVLALLAASPAWATDFHGQVVFGGLPVPGAQATVTATQGDKTVTAVTDDQGLFAFTNLTDGAWTITISLTGFATIKEPLSVAPNGPIPIFELKLQTLEQIRAEAKPVKIEPGAAPVVASATVDAAAASAGDKAGSGKNAASKNGAAKGQTQQAGNATPQAPAPAQEAGAQSPDGYLINGSVNNAATSQFSLAQAFGNARNSRSLYNWGLAFKLNNSVLNANNYSLTGVPSPKPNASQWTGTIQVAGPLKIPHLLPLYRAPNFQIEYDRTQNSTVNTVPYTVPTGFLPNTDYDLSNVANLTGHTVYAPTTGLLAGCTATPGAALPTNALGHQFVPASCISPVAQALLQFYPAPNVTSTTTYNYQLPLATELHDDIIRPYLRKQIGKNNLNGSFYWESSRQSTPSIFQSAGANFVDTQKLTNIGVNASWYRPLTQRLSLNTTYGFTRSHSQTIPFFDRPNGNVSQAVGISGNEQQNQLDYGPPSLGFSGSSIAGLSDSKGSNNRPETNSVRLEMDWNRFRHNMSFGGDFRRQEFNYFQQSNPHGTLSFTGAATSNGAVGAGSDFADFLLGLPDTSQVAFGNPDKYLRQSVYDLFAQDDFRVSPELSVKYGVRWEYEAPVTELKGRLVNLDFANGFTGETPVLATGPVGPLSGQHYPTSLLRPDKAGFEPSVGIAWRPISGSSLLVRSGFSLARDTTVYQQLALAMTGQTPGPNAPWAFTSLSVPNSATCRFTIANPFVQLPCATTTPDTFAVDPNFRVGYVDAWNVIVQRDLPAALQLTVTYNGTKGTRGKREFLPNTYQPGAANPCPSCPVGFYYLDSNGNLTREAGEVYLRRRLRAGLQASADYIYSKAIDDYYSYGGNSAINTGSSSAGSTQVAQDWRHPEAQRGLSTFDQRHVLALQLQYTTGMGLGGHALMGGWRGAVYKEWTVLMNVNLASGMPETPTVPGAVVPGSADTGILRANYNGGPVHLYNAAQKTYLNAAAFSIPTSGWGTAGRDSITGPTQFSVTASMQRDFRLRDRYSMTARVDANNPFNHPTYTSYNSALTSQFGYPSVSQMRSLSVTLRLRH